GRFRAMVLLATFASLRWGEVTALTRSDVDLKAGTVRVRAAFTPRRSNGSAIVIGPPKSRAGRRVVGIPQSILPAERGEQPAEASLEHSKPCADQQENS